jgi:energy-coupling factor transporter ATP-binding protein EcfA2
MESDMSGGNDFYGLIGTDTVPKPHGSPISQVAAETYGRDRPPSMKCSMWGLSGNSFYGVDRATSNLEPGVYDTGISPSMGPFFTKRNLAVDGLVYIEDSDMSTILAEFEKFWSSREKFKARSMVMKRGFMLWGPPGSGKTSLVNAMSKNLIEKHSGVVVMISNPEEASACLSLLRSIEPNRPVILLFEDIDALVNRYGDAGYLALLDGEHQIDNVVSIATTNYPARLDRRFVDRPSRFDIIMKIPMPRSAARRAYFLAKEPLLTGAVLDRWVRETDGLSMAHLKELIIAVYVLDQKFEDVIARFDSMRMRDSHNVDDDPVRRVAGITAPFGRKIG